MGSKYYGRAIKHWRLTAGLSQEELAERAEVSVTLVGTIERERGHLSEEIFIKICLGLESKLGRPMLRAVFTDSVEGLWTELMAQERGLRQEKGLEPAEDDRLPVGQEDLDRALDSTWTELKKLALIWHRALNPRPQEGEWPLEARPEPHGTGTHKRMRVRRPGKKSARPGGPTK